MKFLTPLLFLLFAQGIAIAEEPAKLVERRQEWEKQRTEAQEIIDKLYLAELEELKKNFTKAGNIADGMAVHNEINGGKQGDKEPVMLTKARQARDKSMEKAITTLDKRYWRSLKKLKADYQEQGNLAGVVATDSEIDKVLAAHKKPTAPRSIKIDLGHKDVLPKFEIKGNITVSPGVGIIARGANRKKNKNDVRSFIITKEKYTFPLSVSIRASCEKDGVFDVFSAIFSATEGGGIHLAWGHNYNTGTLVNIFGQRTKIPHKLIKANTDYTITYEISKDRKLKISIDNDLVFETVLRQDLDLSGPICLSGGFGHVVFKELTIIEK